MQRDRSITRYIAAGHITTEGNRIVRAIFAAYATCEDLLPRKLHIVG